MGSVKADTSEILRRLGDPSLHLRRPVAQDFTGCLAAKREGFVGREWLFKRVTAWTASGTSRSMLIVGAPGLASRPLSRKWSRIAKRWVSLRGSAAVGNTQIRSLRAYSSRQLPPRLPTICPPTLKGWKRAKCRHSSRRPKAVSKHLSNHRILGHHTRDFPILSDFLNIAEREGHFTLLGAQGSRMNRRVQKLIGTLLEMRLGQVRDYPAARASSGRAVTSTSLAGTPQPSSTTATRVNNRKGCLSGSKIYSMHAFTRAGT